MILPYIPEDVEKLNRRCIDLLAYFVDRPVGDTADELSDSLKLLKLVGETWIEPRLRENQRKAILAHEEAMREICKPQPGDHDDWKNK